MAKSQKFATVVRPEGKSCYVVANNNIKQIGMKELFQFFSETAAAKPDGAKSEITSIIPRSNQLALSLRRIPSLHSVKYFKIQLSIF